MRNFHRPPSWKIAFLPLGGPLAKCSKTYSFWSKKVKPSIRKCFSDWMKYVLSLFWSTKQYFGQNGCVLGHIDLSFWPQNEPKTTKTLDIKRFCCFWLIFGARNSDQCDPKHLLVVKNNVLMTKIMIKHTSLN